jgi:beta-mannosidase
MYSARISDLYVDVEVEDALRFALLTARVEIDASQDLLIEFMVLDPYGEQIDAKIIQNSTECQFTVHTPELWYPNGYGAQPLYSVVARIRENHSDKILHSKSRKIGIRLSD